MDSLSRPFWADPDADIALPAPGFSLAARVVTDAEEPSRRRAPRQPLVVETVVRELGAPGVDARVLNISAGGFMAESATDFPPGTRVWLLLPGQPRANALVKWSGRGRFGAEFAQAIDPLKVLHATGCQES